MRKVSFFLVTLLTVLLIGIPFAYAQEATASPDTDWQVIEQCIGEPTKPPQDLHYDGTILFRGKYGIHGMRTDWDAPRVLAFTHITNSGSYVHMGYGSFSPDKTHFAAPVGNSVCGSIHCNGTLDEIYGVEVFDVTGNNPRHEDWHSIFTTYGQMTSDYDEPHVVWLDDHQFIYPVFPPGERGNNKPTITDIITGKQTEISEDSDLICWQCAPDHSRQLVSYFQGDFNNQKIVYELRTFPDNQVLQTLDVILPIYAQSWSLDSQQFLAIQRYGENQAYIVEYDRDGKVLGQISPLVTQSQIFTNSHSDTVSWSPDENYILLRLGTIGINQGETELNGYTYLIDIAEHRAYHLCDNISFIQWSPDSKYFAFVDDEDLMLYDVAAQITYRLFDYAKADNYYYPYMLDWRAD